MCTVWGKKANTAEGFDHKILLDALYAALSDTRLIYNTFMVVTNIKCPSDAPHFIVHLMLGVFKLAPASACGHYSINTHTQAIQWFLFPLARFDTHTCSSIINAYVCKYSHHA